MPLFANKKHKALLTTLCKQNSTNEMKTKQMIFISPTGDGFDRTDQADSTQK